MSNEPVRIKIKTSKEYSSFPFQVKEKGKELNTEKEKAVNDIPLNKKSLKRYCYFYSKANGELPNPLKLAGLGDTWIKEYRKIVRQLLKKIPRPSP
jgi:hypothetical protein